MQEPSTFTQIQPQFPEHEQLKCPRCDSTNTKFCYYNNYNLSQPRHFCKNCRRYWTKGGALRNIPVGGGTRKNSKRSSNPKPKTTPSSSSSSVPKIEQPSVFNAGVDQDRRMLDVGGSFSSLLNGQFGNFLEGLDPHGSLGQLGGEFGGDPNLNSNSEPGHHEMRNPQVELQSGGNNPESYLGDSSNWGGGGSNGWPDLSIYTPVLNPKTWLDGWNPGALLSAQQALLSTSRSFKCILDGPDLRDAEECLPFIFGPFKTHLDGRLVLGRVCRAERSVGSLSSNGW